MELLSERIEEIKNLRQIVDQEKYAFDNGLDDDNDNLKSSCHYESQPQISKLLDDIHNLQKRVDLLNKRKESSSRGIPCILINFAESKNQLVKKNDEDFNYDSGDEDKEKEYSIEISYKESIKKLKELDIDILDIEFEPLNYFKGNASCLGGGCTVFMFYCKKNHYVFNVELEDDCDCYPGILYVREVYNSLTNEIYKIGCDLFCQNTSKSKVKDLLVLLDSKDLNDYKEKRFGHFIELQKLLNSDDIKSTFLHENPLDIDDISLNYHDKTLVINVETKEGSCYVIPDGYFKDDLVLSFTPTKKYVLDNTKDKQYISQCLKNNECIDVNTFNWDFHKISASYHYQNSSQLPEVVKNIHNYIKNLNNQYGYYQNDQYYNDKHLQDLKMNNEKYNMVFKHHSDRLKSDYINTTISVNFKIPYWILDQNFESSELYPYDYYDINILYDKEKGSNCNLEINGYWHNINYSFKKDYYNSSDIYNKNYFNDKVNEVNNIVSYTFEGTFLEVYGEVKRFFNLLKN